LKDRGRRKRFEAVARLEKPGRLETVVRPEKVERVFELIIENAIWIEGIPDLMHYFEIIGKVFHCTKFW
jgi:hypothetical protein